jgi:hypothetical protein
MGRDAYRHMPLSLEVPNSFTASVTAHYFEILRGHRPRLQLRHSKLIPLFDGGLRKAF